MTSPTTLRPAEFAEFCLIETLANLGVAESAVDRLRTESGHEFDVACHLSTARLWLEKAQAELGSIIQEEQELIAYAAAWDTAAQAEREDLAAYVGEWDLTVSAQASAVLADHARRSRRRRKGGSVISA